MLKGPAEGKTEYKATWMETTIARPQEALPPTSVQEVRVGDKGVGLET